MSDAWSHIRISSFVTTITAVVVTVSNLQIADHTGQRYAGDRHLIGPGVVPPLRGDDSQPVTCGGGGGTTLVTCRRAIPITGAPARSVPQSAHQLRSQTMTSSGSSTSGIIESGAPGLRPEDLCVERGTGLRYDGSNDGGFGSFIRTVDGGDTGPVDVHSPPTP